MANNLINLENKKPNKVKSICALIDASRSMSRERENVQAALHLLVAMSQIEGMRLARQAGIELFMGIGVFPNPKTNETLQWKYDLFNNIERINYDPTGHHTPLYEAVSIGIDKLDAVHIKGDVVFEIISDGGDNGYVNPPKEKVLAKIAQGWHFIFIGEGRAAIRAAEAMGIPQQCRISCSSKQEMIAAMKKVTRRTKQYLLTGNPLLLTFQG